MNAIYYRSEPHPINLKLTALLLSTISLNIFVKIFYLMGMPGKLREEFIRLLETDIEFRYIVAGYLGWSEILKRLDEYKAEANRIWMEINKIWKELKELKQDVSTLKEDVSGLKQDVGGLKLGQAKLSKDVRWLMVAVERLGRAVGMSLEDYTIAFIRILLEDLGYPLEKIRVDRKILVYRVSL